MKVLAKNETLCIVNGAEIAVPFGVKFISIDMAGRVEFWLELPYMSEGYWYHDRSNSIRAYQVTMEEGDTWTKLYSVDSHSFVDMYYD